MNIKKYLKHFEAIIYGILVFAIITITIIGPIYFKFIPMLFILGIIGRLFFNRPIMTSALGTIASICVIQIVSDYDIIYNIGYSVFCGISILLGEVSEIYLAKVIKFFNEHKIKKYTNKSKIKNRYNISVTVSIFFVAAILNSYINGDFYSYNKAKDILNNYITTNYGQVKYNIHYAKHSITNLYTGYEFKIEDLSNDNRVYKMIVYSHDKIIDKYKDVYLESKSNELKSKISYLNYNNFSFDLKLNDFDNTKTLYITKKVDIINDNALNLFAEDINNILSDVEKHEEYEKITKMNIEIKDSKDLLFSIIDKENFFNNKYYIDSIKTEYLD